MRVMKHFTLWALGLTDPETQTTEAERQCLSHYAHAKKRLAEIGVWHGVTTCCIRRAMSPDGTLFAVDPYPVGRLGFSPQQIIAHREVGTISNGSVVWIRRTGEAAGRQLQNAGIHVDFVFIDGDHSYEGLKADWEVWRQLVAPGGIIALHDSRSTNARNIDDAGSVRFTNEVIANDTTFTVAETVDSLTVLTRSSEFK